MVRQSENRALPAGADPAEVFADPFDYRDLRKKPRAAEAAAPGGDAPAPRPDPPPDPELWTALDEGRLLSEILGDFYGRVYQDPRLAPFFRNITLQRAIEKQFAFLREILTGEKLFFGERPANAHHWMVISDELFDYREELFMACVARAGIEAHWIERWRSLHEHYRRDLVKSAPRPKRMGSTELPLDGFGEEKMTVGTLCDVCGRAIEIGERVRYHLRLGETFCSDCSGPSLSSGGREGAAVPV
jgi:truncated hemoglobin YjbI